MNRPRAVLICHNTEPLNRYGLARWMASFTDLAAIVEIHEPPKRLWRRLVREYRRIGTARLVDVFAYRLYYRLFLATKDREWEARLLESIEQRYEALSPEVRIFETASPNSAETEKLLDEVQPEIIIARCKTILKPGIFKKASVGTLVMHPGICPEYRNAHGCFWALARSDADNAGMTLLKVDEGVDTGPVYGYYRCDYNEVRETPNIIQNRVVFDNLDGLRAKVEEIAGGTAQIIDTRGRTSRAWGQPWLSAYLGWKRRARRDSKLPRSGGRSD